jgi:cyanophycin synthetase
MAERAAHAAGLSYCGVDFITADISRSWREIGGAINEINFQPGLRSHALTHPGRQWEEEILRRMFARGGARIPIVGCSGNDAEAFSLLAQRLLSYDGMVAGTGGPWGVRIGDDIVRDACPSGFHAGQMLLADPAVEAAVVHLTADDLAACGTPFDRCDVAVLLPEADESASRVQVRRELLARARYGVLDASDPIVRECVMGPETEPLILVATHDGHPAVLAHLAAGGCAAVLEERNGATCLVLREGRSRQMMMRADRLVRSQTASSIGIERCALYAFAAAFALGIDETPTRLALERSFDLLQDVLVLHDPARGGAGI